MSDEKQYPFLSQEELDSVDERGMTFYDETLKAILEPQHNNEYVAIHVATYDYTIGRSTGDAMRAMRKKPPSGSLFLRKIGDEPDYGLAARLLASDMISGRNRGGA